MEVVTRGGEMAVMDDTGDTKIVWDSDKTEEVDHARRTFDELRKNGYIAYSVNKKGDQGEVLREFNPDIEKMILAPRTVGG